MRVARACFAVVTAFVLAFVLWLVVLCTAPFDRRRDFVNQIGRLWFRWWKLTLGFKVQVRGEENIRSGGPFLFVGNHASYLDVIALFTDFPVTMRFLAKKTLIYVPFFGLGLLSLDHVYINRRRKDHHQQALAGMAKRARDGKHLFIFPTGRRVPDGQIGEWKKGSFVLATQLQVPVVPVAITGSAKLFGIGHWLPRPGLITIHIGRPIPTAGMTYDDRDRLLQAARAQVEEMLHVAA